MPTYIYTFVTHNFNFNKMEQENINVETPQEQNEEQKEQQVFTENVTTETTEQEPSDSVVEDDDFLSQILNQEDEPSEPKGEDPEIAEAKNYKSLIEQDDFLKQVIAAKKAGADIKEVVNQFLSPDYSESEPERVFKDYLRREDSNLSEDELDYEYANFIGDRENLSIVQKKTIRDWAKYLNENKPKNDWTKIAVEREEIMKRASQKTNELINDLNGQRIMARRNDLGQLEGGYVFDADSVKRTEKVAKAIASGAFINADGTPRKELIEMISLWANKDRILSTIATSSASDSKIEFLKEQANLTKPKGGQPAPRMTDKKAASLQEQWKLAQQELEAKGKIS